MSRAVESPLNETTNASVPDASTAVAAPCPSVSKDAKTALIFGFAWKACSTFA